MNGYGAILKHTVLVAGRKIIFPTFLHILSVPYSFYSFLLPLPYSPYMAIAVGEFVQFIKCEHLLKVDT